MGSITCPWGVDTWEGALIKSGYLNASPTGVFVPVLFPVCIRPCEGPILHRGPILHGGPILHR